MKIPFAFIALALVSALRPTTAQAAARNSLKAQAAAGVGARPSSFR